MTVNLQSIPEVSSFQPTDNLGLKTSQNSLERSNLRPDSKLDQHQLRKGTPNSCMYLLKVYLLKTLN